MDPFARLPIPSAQRVDERRLRREVTGRTIAITGASSGIGEAAALRLGRAGAHVVLIARRAAKLEAVARQLSQATVLVCDLADATATDALGEQLLSLGVHGLVSNAGHSIRRPLIRSPSVAEDAERLMAVNYLAPVRLIGALLASLADQRGQVVVVSSIAAQTGAPGFAAYTASKAALDAFVRSASRERAARGVAFTTIYMPLVRTPMVAPSPDLTEDLASLSPERAADLIASAVVHRPRRIGTPAGELAALGWAIDPAISTAIDSRLRRSASGSGEGGPRSVLGRLAALAVTTNVRR